VQQVLVGVHGGVLLTDPMIAPPPAAGKSIVLIRRISEPFGSHRCSSALGGGSGVAVLDPNAAPR
jgi:hypothetical protein